jgi:hypothetical protein
MKSALPSVANFISISLSSFGSETCRHDLPIIKIKGEVVPVLFFLTEHHAMKAYWGSGGMAPLVL